LGFFLVMMSAAYPQNRRIDSLNNLLRVETRDTAIIRLQLNLGVEYGEQFNDSAMIFLQDALQRSISGRHRQLEILTRHQLAYYYNSNKSDYTTAMDLYLKNLEMVKQYNDTSLVMRDMHFFGLRDMGLIYERIKDYDNAQEYNYRMRDLLNSGYFSKEPRYHDRSRKILFNRLGSVYVYLGKLDSAQYYFRSLLHEGARKYDPTMVALTSMGLGNVFKAEGKTDSSAFYYHAAMPSSINAGRTDIYNRILLAIAELYFQNKQIDSAYYYGHAALAVARKEKSTARMMTAEEILAKVYNAKGKTDSAYLYLHESIQLNDSVAGTEKLMAIQNMESKREFKQQQEERDREQAIREYQSRVQFYGLAALLLFISIVAVILYRSNRQKHQANLQIERSLHELKNTQTQLIHAEKMASLGELTAGIAHEIQNPLNFVNNFSELNTELIEEMKEELGKGNSSVAIEIARDISENEKKINHHGKRADSIVKGMLQHSRSSSGQKEMTDVNVLVDECLRLSYHGMRAKDKSFNAKMETHFDASATPLLIIPQDIGRVLLNLFTNAFYAVMQKAKNAPADFDPCVTASTIREKDGITIQVKDNGPGVPQAVMDKIFQPFFTTKPTGEGTGLGLSMSYDIITKEHGGSISVESKEGEFAVFTIFLPAKP